MEGVVWRTWIRGAVPDLSMDIETEIASLRSPARCREILVSELGTSKIHIAVHCFCSQGQMLSCLYSLRTQISTIPYMQYLEKMPKRLQRRQQR
jgi:hypothetical protein